MKLIPLTKGYHAIVDDEDFDRLTTRKWHAEVKRPNDLVYARASDGTRMQHAVLGLPRGSKIDHANGDGLDNRKENLRPCTLTDNFRNRRGWSSSGYKGVTRHGKGWRARIHLNGRVVRLGDYSTPEEAARVYDREARMNFGVFAKLNFPIDVSSDLK